MMVIIVAVYWISILGSFLSVFMLFINKDYSYLGFAYYLLGVTLLSSMVIALAYMDKTC